ncbi:hypothetical protein ACOME3_010442 [Neoechinorhynchus agilis]
MSIGFAFYKAVRGIEKLMQYSNIKRFYTLVLNINDEESLRYMTWDQIQDKMIAGQREHCYCQHNVNVSKLDIHNRMLRYVNYEVSLVNYGLIRPVFHLPFLGEVTYYTQLFGWMFRYVVFKSGIIFKDKWHLQPNVRSARDEYLIEQLLTNKALQLSVPLFILSPGIVLLGAIDLFYTYTQSIRTNPSFLSKRTWSPYGRLYIRHLNELDHELDARLRRAYELGVHYLDTNFSPLKNALVSFALKIIGPIGALIFLASLFEPDVLLKEGVVLSLTIIGVFYNLLQNVLVDERELNPSREALELLIRQIH